MRNVSLAVAVFTLMTQFAFAYECPIEIAAEVGEYSPGNPQETEAPVTEFDVAVLRQLDGPVVVYRPSDSDQFVQLDGQAPPALQELVSLDDSGNVPVLKISGRAGLDDDLQVEVEEGSFRLSANQAGGADPLTLNLDRESLGNQLTVQGNAGEADAVNVVMDNTTQEQMYLSPHQAFLVGDFGLGQDLSFTNFADISVVAGDTTDQANFEGSDGVDEFIGSATTGVLKGSGYELLAQGFSTYFAQGETQDSGNLTGADSDDLLTVTGNDRVSLWTASTVTILDGFGGVDADGGGGNDRASVSDSNGDDALEIGAGTFGFSNAVVAHTGTSFEFTEATSLAGGTDTVALSTPLTPGNPNWLLNGNWQVSVDPTAVGDTPAVVPTTGDDAGETPSPGDEPSDTPAPTPTTGDETPTDPGDETPVPTSGDDTADETPSLPTVGQVIPVSAGTQSGFTVEGDALLTSTRNGGIVSFKIDVPQDGEYVLLLNARTPNEDSDEFRVFVDAEPAEVVDAAQGAWSEEFQWTPVNRVLSLTQGVHTITVCGFEEGASLRAIKLQEKAVSDGTVGETDGSDSPPPMDPPNDTPTTTVASVGQFVEADAGNAENFVVEARADASSSNFLEATDNPGFVDFTVNVPENSAGTYEIWARMLAKNENRDSFSVSVNGADPVLFELGQGWSNNFQWRLVTATQDGNTSVLQTQFDAGDQQIRFLGREGWTGIDGIVLAPATLRQTLADRFFDGLLSLPGSPAAGDDIFDLLASDDGD